MTSSICHSLGGPFGSCIGFDGDGDGVGDGVGEGEGDGVGDIFVAIAFGRVF